jgi:hypothetical protein
MLSLGSANGLAGLPSGLAFLGRAGITAAMHVPGPVRDALGDRAHLGPWQRPAELGVFHADTNEDGALPIVERALALEAADHRIAPQPRERYLLASFCYGLWLQSRSEPDGTVGARHRPPADCLDQCAQAFCCATSPTSNSPVHHPGRGDGIITENSRDEQRKAIKS